MVSNELRLALRRLRADPWAAGGAILAAALGAGLNTAVFAVAYGVLVRPLPYRDAARLAIVNTETPFAHVGAWRAGLTSFERVAAYARDTPTIYGAGDPRVAGVAVVDDQFFETLGAQAERGRTLGHGDDAACVIGEEIARQIGASTDSVLGHQLVVGDSSLTVIGVMPDAFAFPSDQIKIWMPAAAAHAIAFDQRADARRFSLVGRLKPGASIAQAHDDAARAERLIDPTSRQPGSHSAVAVTSLDDTIVGAVRPVLLAFAAAGVIVLLIACANVATILIGRTLARQRDLAVRRALGASAGRLVMSVVSESLVISLTGAALGVALALACVQIVERWAAGIIPRLGAIRIDGAVLAFTIASAVLASLLAALPAFKAVRQGTLGLRTTAAGIRPGDRRLRGALVVVQIALAVVLLTAGGLLTRTIVGLLQGDTGVTTRGAVVSQVLLTQNITFNANAEGPKLRDLLTRIRALPGVTAAGAGSSLPPENALVQMVVRFVGDRGERSYVVTLGAATPGYLPALGARLLQGRDFAEDDEHSGKPVVVVSESAARKVLQQQPADVIGRDLTFSLPGPLRTRPRATIIGVVSDVKYQGLEQAAGPTVYAFWNDLPIGRTYLAVRASGDPASLAAPIHAAIRDIDPRMPLMPVRTLDEVLQRSVADRRLRAVLGGAVALLAFAVAMVGLAASLMRIVSERRHELAIRAALGATPARAVRAVMTEGAALAAIGLVLGGLGALAAGRALRTMLQGVGPYDPATLIGVTAAVGVTAILACYFPARRAARVDPLALLRSE